LFDIRLILLFEDLLLFEVFLYNRLCNKLFITKILFPFSFLDNDENRLPSLSNQSTLQYLFSTRTKHTDAEEATPILGFGLLQEPCVLVALLHTGVVVDLSVIDLHYLPRIEQLEPAVNTTKKVIIITVYSYIKN